MGYSCAFFRDITERKRREEKLHQALNESEQLRYRLQAENIYLQEEVQFGHNLRETIGHSKALKKVLWQVEQVAYSESSVLILGETGTGKELLAKAIHSLSRRRDRALVCINSAALTETLLEAELFGFVKGAFTGAVTNKPGRLEMADGGTLFLDEIGHMSINLRQSFSVFFRKANLSLSEASPVEEWMSGSSQRRTMISGKRSNPIDSLATFSIVLK